MPESLARQELERGGIPGAISADWPMPKASDSGMALFDLFDLSDLFDLFDLLDQAPDTVIRF